MKYKLSWAARGTKESSTLATAWGTSWHPFLQYGVWGPLVIGVFQKFPGLWALVLLVFAFASVLQKEAKSCAVGSVGHVYAIFELMITSRLCT